MSKDWYEFIGERLYVHSSFVYSCYCDIKFYGYVGYFHPFFEDKRIDSTQFLHKFS